MHPILRRFGKSLLEIVLPAAEHLTGFRTARGDYLPNRIKLLFGRYEAGEMTLMRQFLRPGQTIVDVGANVGYLTRFFAQSTGPNGKVCAFEPNPIIFPLLERNVSRFKQVSVYNFALAATTGELPLFLAGNDHSVASFAREYPAAHVFYQESSRLDSIPVKLVAGDKFLAETGINQMDILKIDVEGWELNVLHGLERTIRASPGLTIFCEFNPTAQECAGRSKGELLNWFFDRQFALARPSRNELRPISRPSLDNFIDAIEPGQFVTLFATRE